MGVIRKTKSLELILNTFDESKTALSVVDLIDRFVQQMNKTTIYRILERLEQDGVVHSFIDKDGLKWYAKCIGCSSEHHSDIHPHFQCQDCGKIDCLDIHVSIPSVPNRDIDFSRILLVGKCENCRA